MTQGVLLFAQNNSRVDYVKQAMFCAKRIKEYLKLPVCLVTPNVEYLDEYYPNHKNYFDHIVKQQKSRDIQYKKFRDGLYSEKQLEWHNLSRADAYDLTPFDETIVMDTDVIICNDTLLECFNSTQDFMIAKESKDLKVERHIPAFQKVSDRSINMVWATLFYFKKNSTTKILFDLIKHIKENYNFYRLTYKISEKKYRNDFAFSIAIHILNGHQKTNWPKPLPGNLWFTTDLDVLVKMDKEDERYTFLLDKKDWKGHYTLSSIEDANIHIMNKFSLDRAISEALVNE